MSRRNTAKKEVSPLKSHMGYWLRVVSNDVSQSFARKLSACHVTVAEWVVLREMYATDETTSPSVIAEVTGLSRGTVSKLIDRLLNKKLVTRAESVSDRRYQTIQLTEASMELIPKLAHLADENDAEFFSILSETEQESLRAILITLSKRHKLNTNPIR